MRNKFYAKLRLLSVFTGNGHRYLVRYYYIGIPRGKYIFISFCGDGGFGVQGLNMKRETVNTFYKSFNMVGAIGRYCMLQNKNSLCLQIPPGCLQILFQRK